MNDQEIIHKLDTYKVEWLDGLLIDAIKSRLEELAKLKKALQEIKDLQVVDVTDGAGPIDCSPRERGYMYFVGKAHIIATEALEAR